MVKRNHKYKSGEGAQYFTRKAAMKKLQLSMRDFRQLCILKGIYPREPKNRARAQHGSRDIKILYHKKDITFLLHEPIVWTLRERKIYNRRIAHAMHKKNMKLRNIRMHNYPEMKLDHIVKERFPTFIDAIKELDDCMTLLFLFSTFPATKIITRDLTNMARRLTVEFMHYIIVAQALRKVFISIKGYYFQAEIKGQTVTWIVPHYFPHQYHKGEMVDFTIMRSFADFFVIMAGFINFRLYHSVNLVYPPQFSHTLNSDETIENEDSFISERIAALNTELLRSDGGTSGSAEEEDVEAIEWTGVNEDMPHVEQIREEAQSLKKLKTLFKGLKFFLNREVPREPLVFIIRCFGGKVSWDRTMYVGATFDESDETITHHVVDRPSVAKQYISRDYIQPQWVFDSVNQRKLLPTNKYFIGAVLPPHLSPFNREDVLYVPPEELSLKQGGGEEVENEFEQFDRRRDDGHISDDEEEVSDSVKAQQQQVQRDYALLKAFNDENTDEFNTGPDVEVPANEDGEEEEDNEQNSKDEQKKSQKQQQQGTSTKGMAVVSGKVYKENPNEQKKVSKQEEMLRSKLIKSKHRKLYHMMMEKQKKAEKEANILTMKRAQIEKEKKREQVVKRKEQKKQILT